MTGLAGTIGVSSTRQKKSGQHWNAKRAKDILGDLFTRRGVYVVGGYALTLFHRHDIRVGIDCSMFLRHYVSDVAARLELLAVL